MSLRALLVRALDLLRCRRIERELDDEILAHLEQAELDNLRAGLSPGEARRATRLSFGGVEQVIPSASGRVRLASAWPSVQIDETSGGCSQPRA